MFSKISFIYPPFVPIIYIILHFIFVYVCYPHIILPFTVTYSQEYFYLQYNRDILCTVHCHINYAVAFSTNFSK